MRRHIAPTYKIKRWPAENEPIKNWGWLMTCVHPETGCKAAPIGKRGRYQTFGDYCRACLPDDDGFVWHGATEDDGNPR